MNALKFQQALVEAYIRKPGDIHEAAWLKKDEGHVMLMLKGVVCVFMPEKDTVLNLAKLPTVPQFTPVLKNALRTGVLGNQLTPTEEYRFGPGNRKIRIYQGRTWRIGIDQGLLKYFDMATVRFYQQEEKGPILINEKSRGFEESVGLVYPCRI